MTLPARVDPSADHAASLPDAAASSPDDGSVVPTYCCPLTLLPPTDPVIDPDGHTYERQAIEQWVIEYKCSPMTRQPLTLGQLVPNRALLDQISGNVTGESIQPNVKALIHDQDEDDETAITRAMEHMTLATSNVQVKCDVSDKDGTTLATVSVIPPDTETRGGIDVVCVIDLSYSMSNAADLKSDDDDDASEGFLSILQLVKHSVATCIEGLRNIDRLSLVSFSTASKVELPLTRMDKAGKAKAQSTLSDLAVHGSTNIWGGLKCAMDLLAKEEGDNMQHVMLFTDGQPNVNPPRGNLPTLEKYLQTEGSKNQSTLHTFGFGYSLDSKLLHDIACLGGGVFGFIPDAGFVGTMFINAMANMMTCIGRQMTVTVTPNKGVSIETVVGLNKSDWMIQSKGECKIKMTSLHLGQTRNVSLALKLKIGSGYQCSKPLTDWLHTIKVDFSSGTKSKHVITKAEPIAEISEDDAYSPIIHADCLRMLAVQSGYRGVKKSDAGPVKTFLNARLTKKSVRGLDSDKVNDLIIDFKKEITTGLDTKVAFEKWGKHYVYSIMRAHQLQQRTNFKDPGLQHYGGRLFEKLQEKLEEVFLTVPAPKPTVRMVSSTGSISYRTGTHASNMSSYYRAGGVCFAGSNMVLMHDGTTKRVDCVRKGDMVRTSLNTDAIATVECVVETLHPQDKDTLMVRVGTLMVTPYHPILWNGEWLFPKDVGVTVPMRIPSVYSFVVDTHHSMVIEGTVGICLAHGLTTNNVVSHPFFGTGAVLEALKAAPYDAYTKGHVLLPPHACVRTGDTENLVCGFQFVNQRQGLDQDDVITEPTLVNCNARYTQRTIAAV